VATRLGRSEIVQNLKLLSEWLRVKHPEVTVELTVVGGAALALMGFEKQTGDIDILVPDALPEAVKRGIVQVAKAKRLPPGWINPDAANIFRDLRRRKTLPQYFRKAWRTLEIGKNLKVNVIGRQALISMKLYAATPSFAKHTQDLVKLGPSAEEVKEALRFVLSVDSHESRQNDLRIILKGLGFEFDELRKEIDR
jgi:hypothetical protein